MLDELIDRVWLIIYNKNKEKNKIINIGVEKDKDIEGYVNIYNKIVDDKLEFVNRISELFNNAIEKKEFNNLKDDILKLIGNSGISDVERKGCKKDNNKKDSGVKRKGRKKDNNKKKIMMIAKMLILIMIKIMIKIMIMIKVMIMIKII